MTSTDAHSETAAPDAFLRYVEGVTTQATLDALLAGLSADELATIKNWDFPIAAAPAAAAPVEVVIPFTG